MKNSKFDIDLKYGQEREKKVVSLLDQDKNKLEVKTERDWWAKTGNIAIEVECWGKPSGLSKTEADYWVHILAIGKEDYCKLIFEVPNDEILLVKKEIPYLMAHSHQKFLKLDVPIKVDIGEGMNWDEAH